MRLIPERLINPGKYIGVLFFALFWLALPTPAHAQTPAAGPIFWGAYISGTTWGISNPPWDVTAWNYFEADASNTGKKISILHYGSPWRNSVGWPQGDYPFEPTLFDTIRSRGAIPFLDWGSWDLGLSSRTVQPSFTLSSIINGTHDSYLTQWATAAKAWGHPFFLRFDWEMNGTWFPWSEAINGNSTGQFIPAWRHVHDIFTTVGAGNVNWVWCPNTIYSGSIPLTELYPGDAYVDWTCMDGYNWSSVKSNPWMTPYQVFKPTYDQIVAIAPNKPIIIGETASSELGGSKAAWITDFLTVQLPNSFPQVKGFLWFNWNTDNADWVIETSTTARDAFRNGIALPYYTSNTFGNISSSPIAPPSPLSVSPTVTPIPTTILTPTPTAIRTPTPTPTTSANVSCFRKQAYTNSGTELANNALVQKGDIIFYNLTIKNTGLGTSQPTTLNDTFPISVVDFYGAQSANCQAPTSSNPSVVTCNIPPLASNATDTEYFKVQVKQTTTVSSFTNYASIAQFPGNTACQISLTLPIPTPTPTCLSGSVGNLNCDSGGLVNETDLSILLSRWTTTGPLSTPGANQYSADLNHDGYVDEMDLTKLLTNWKT